jgi:hypothetical protein
MLRKDAGGAKAGLAVFAALTTTSNPGKSYINQPSPTARGRDPYQRAVRTVPWKTTTIQFQESALTSLTSPTSVIPQREEQIHAYVHFGCILRPFMKNAAVNPRKRRRSAQVDGVLESSRRKGEISQSIIVMIQKYTKTKKVGIDSIRSSQRFLLVPNVPSSPSYSIAKCCRLRKGRKHFLRVPVLRHEDLSSVLPQLSAVQDDDPLSAPCRLLINREI